jgi:hypothetical protein
MILFSWTNRTIVIQRQGTVSLVQFYVFELLRLDFYDRTALLELYN